tara:strand:- start:294 stop:560 length:267 start_codon:yes stop_codon:yes gene_type:complete
MKYSKEEYDKMLKMHMPINDAHITGKKPEVIGMIRSSTDKVKTIQYLLEKVILKSKTKESIDEVKQVLYLCEEVIVANEETILEINKI